MEYGMIGTWVINSNLYQFLEYPDMGDPLASAVNGEGNLEELIQIYFDNNNSTPILAQNWTDNENPFQSAFSQNPLFVNQADPDGPDDIWMIRTMVCA